MMMTRTWIKRTIAAIAVATMMMTAGAYGYAAPAQANLKVVAQPITQMVSAQLEDAHHFYKVTGTVVATQVRLGEKVAIRYQLKGGADVKTAVAALNGKTVDGKVMYAFELLLNEKRSVDQAGIELQAIRLNTNGEWVNKGKLDPIYTIGGAKGDVALGTAKLTVQQTTFDWNENVAAGTVAVKTEVGAKAVELYYQTNDVIGWKKTTAEKVVTVGGVDQWKFAVKVTGTTDVIKWKVVYKTTGEALTDRTNQLEWKWTR